jgi:hypothetical protein
MPKRADLGILAALLARDHAVAALQVRHIRAASSSSTLTPDDVRGGPANMGDKIDDADSYKFFAEKMD